MELMQLIGERVQKVPKTERFITRAARRICRLQPVENKQVYVIRISENNFGYVDGIKSVPLYAVFCI